MERGGRKALNYARNQPCNMSGAGDISLKLLYFFSILRVSSKNGPLWENELHKRHSWDDLRELMILVSR